MEWQTPADAYWANNYAVTCHARISRGKALVRYTAIHFPTRHTEEAPTRAHALNRLVAWISTQVAPTKPSTDSPYGPEARRKALQDRVHALLQDTSAQHV